MKSQKITCYLLKDCAKLFRNKKKNNSCNGEIIRIEINDNTILYYKKVKYRSRVYDFLSTIDNIDNFSILFEDVVRFDALIIKEIKYKNKKVCFALSFNGRHLIDSSCYNENFGLRVALNLINNTEINKMYTKEISDNPKLIFQQLAIRNSQEFFRINDNLDILHGISGKIDSSYKKIRKFMNKSLLTNTIEGKTSFIVSTKLSITEIDRLLSTLYSIYCDNKYKEKGFSWIDNISIIDDEDKKDLDLKLLEKIKNSELSSISISLPDFIQYEEIGKFVILKKEFDELPTIQDILNNNFDLKTLMRCYMTVYDNNNTILRKIVFYNCITIILEYKKENYVLFTGNWYKISKNFVKEVNNKYNEIIANTSSINFIDFHKAIHINENGYNKKLAQSLGDQAIVMDSENISHGEHFSKIEFCDVFDEKNGNLIHIKRFSGSHSMSHLFAQGAHSFKLISTDSDFKSKVLNKISCVAQRKNIDLNKKFNVVYGIISDNIELPFFSKLTLIEYVDIIKKTRNDTSVYVNFIKNIN